MTRDGKPVYILPSGPVSFIAAAEIFFHDLGQMCVLFIQGSKIVEIVKDEVDDTARLEPVTVNGLRTRIEKLGLLHVYRKRDENYLLAANAHCTELTAKALHASEEARKHLPRINVVVNCPLITDYAI